MKTYILCNLKRQFWTGSNWSDEYPDAQIYENLVAAKRDARKHKDRLTVVNVIADYGMNNEEIIYTNMWE